MIIKKAAYLSAAFFMNYPWGHNRRFNAYANYFRKVFGERVQKISINAGLTCPNRDGSISFNGCTYCNNNAFNPSYCRADKSITTQIKEGMEFHAKRYRRANKFLAYFQTFSNTYAPLAKLKKIYEEALAFPGIIGLIIGTRPDCITDEILDLLKDLNKKYYILVELGIESCYDRTLKRINRGHTFDQAVEALGKISTKGIKTGGHFIFGLPGESKDEMLKEAEIISALPINTVKFHQLQIIRNTRMENEYQIKPSDFLMLSLEEYVDFIISFVEKLNPNIVIERFAGEVPPRFLAGPGWGLIRNDQVLQLIGKNLQERDTWQGRLFT